MLDSRVCITVDDEKIHIKYQDVSPLVAIEILERLLFVGRSAAIFQEPLLCKNVEITFSPTMPGEKKVCIAFDGNEQIEAYSNGLSTLETMAAMQWASTYLQAVILGLRE